MLSFTYISLLHNKVILVISFFTDSAIVLLTLLQYSEPVSLSKVVTPTIKLNINLHSMYIIVKARLKKVYQATQVLYLSEGDVGPIH